MHARNKWKIMAAALVLGGQGCAGGSGGADANKGHDEAKERQVLADFGAQVVVPTYGLLARRAAALSAAVDAFKAAKTPETLTALRDAWSATRTPWEQSEAFLFGPVESFGFDAAVDSWPLNHTDLTAVLDSSADFTAALVDSLGDNQKGFHAVEFLIFGEAGGKKAEAFTDRELAYMKAAADSLAGVATALARSWTEGADGKEPFQRTLALAGQPGNATYPSLSAALQEIVEGMAAICGEVANAKIATPFDAQDPNLVESQFSYNSLRDFADNLRSVQNAYTGSNPAAGTSGASLASLVVAADPALDAETRREIDAAIAAVQAVPEPFPVSLKDPANAPVIKAAQAMIRELQATLRQRVEPVVSK